MAGSLPRARRRKHVKVPCALGCGRSAYLKLRKGLCEHCYESQRRFGYKTRGDLEVMLRALDLQRRRIERALA